MIFWIFFAIVCIAFVAMAVNDGDIGHDETERPRMHWPEE